MDVMSGTQLHEVPSFLAVKTWPGSLETAIIVDGTCQRIPALQSCRLSGLKALHIPELTLSEVTAGSAGGRVSALALLQQTGDRRPAVAVAVDTQEPPNYAFGMRHNGPGHIQIWRALGQTDLYRCCASIEHTGVYAHRLQWCPAGDALSTPGPEGISTSHPNRCELLMAVLANGTVVIFSVPQLDNRHMSTDGLLQHKYAALKLKQHVTITDRDLAGHIPTAAAWSPHAPHEDVVVGSAEGDILLVRLAHDMGGAGPAFTRRSLVKVTASAVRCLAWAPVADTEDGDPGGDYRHLFAVGGGQGFLAVYDAREPQVALLDVSRSGQATPNDLLWLPGAGAPVLIAALATGFILQVPLHQDSKGISVFATVTSRLYGLSSLAHSTRLQLIGYATGGGDAGLACGLTRMPAHHMLPRSAAHWASRYTPQTVVLRATMERDATITIQIGNAIPDVGPLSESTRGAQVDDGSKDDDDALGDSVVHPLASIRAMGMCDCDCAGSWVVCATGGGLLLFSKVMYRDT